MGPKQISTLYVWVDLRVMGIKNHSTLPRIRASTSDTV